MPMRAGMRPVIAIIILAFLLMSAQTYALGTLGRPTFGLQLAVENQPLTYDASYFDNKIVWNRALDGVYICSMLPGSYYCLAGEYQKILDGPMLIVSYRNSLIAGIENDNYLPGRVFIQNLVTGETRYFLDNNDYKSKPAIYNDLVLFSDYDAMRGHATVYLYNFTSATLKVIDDRDIYIFPPTVYIDMYGDNIVYSYSFTNILYLYKISTGNRAEVNSPDPVTTCCFMNDVGVLYGSNPVYYYNLQTGSLAAVANGQGRQVKAAASLTDHYMFWTTRVNESQGGQFVKSLEGKNIDTGEYVAIMPRNRTDLTVGKGYGDRLPIVLLGGIGRNTTDIAIASQGINK